MVEIGLGAFGGGFMSLVVIIGIMGEVTDIGLAENFQQSIDQGGL